MATFAAWVKAQDRRDDAVGNFARYWEQVTPGRISTPTGMERHLQSVDASLAASGDERGRIALAAALSGYHLAVKEYHQAEALDNAVRTGAIARPEAHVGEQQPQPQQPQQPDDEARDALSALLPRADVPPAPGSYSVPAVQPDDSPAGRLKEHAARNGAPYASQRELADRIASLEKLCGEILAALDYRVTQRLDSQDKALDRIAWLLNDLHAKVDRVAEAGAPIDWDALWRIAASAAGYGE